MQLTRAPGRIGAALCVLTANLLAATGASAQSSPTNPGGAPEVGNAYDRPALELGTTTLDAAILYYDESGNRVRAIEPMVALTSTRQNGDVLTAKITFDSLTGATPNGATRWSGRQDFVAPIDDADAATGASGTVVTNPVTGATERHYSTAPGVLPVDEGFRDHRAAIDLGYSRTIAADTRLSAGANVSIEQDYQSFSGRLGIARDLNNKTTNLSLGVNYEHDKSKPYHGIPVGLSPMSGTGNDRTDTKDVISAVAGVTQILRPNWLVQLNYSFGSNKGYQTDPYRILSLLDPATGGPLGYLYESRPRSRTRHAVYAATKLALGSFVTDLSARYSHDSWGIDSITAEIAEHVPIGSRAYIEPRLRYYHQTKADFFRYFLLAGDTLPQFASSDSRLDQFSSITAGATAGYRINDRFEIYANGAAYRQSKSGGYGTVPAGLAGQKLFTGADAVIAMVGVKVKL